MGLVSGKVALVTGAGGGIGRATALKFVEEGAKVIASDVNSDEGNETAALITQNGGDAVFARADVTRSADVKALIATVVDTYGRFDCACNNAGIEGKIAAIAEQSEDDFDRVMSVNAKGNFGMTALTGNNNIVVVPVHSGIGLRLGANLGWLKFTDSPTWNPF